MDRTRRGDAGSAEAAGGRDQLYLYGLQGSCKSDSRDGDSWGAGNWRGGGDGRCAGGGVQKCGGKTIEGVKEEFVVIWEAVGKTGRTAVDLFWALERMKARFAELTRSRLDLAGIRQALIEEAKEVHAEKKAMDEAI